MTKVVDVFLKDRLVASYPVNFLLNGQGSEKDLINLVKDAMRDDEYAPEDVASAKFEVRTVLE
jgi:hypothetical protein